MERRQYGLCQCRLSGCHGGVRAVARRRVRERSALPESRQRLFQAGYERAGHTQLPEGAQARSGDEDIRYNLSIAEARTQDRIESVPVFFVKRWIVSLGRSVGSNTWAVLSLVFFALMLFCTGVYLLLRRVSFQKAGFCGALVSLLLFVVSVAYASAGRKARLHPDEAVVMSSAAPGQKLARRLEHRYFRAA